MLKSVFCFEKKIELFSESKINIIYKDDLVKYQI